MDTSKEYIKMCEKAEEIQEIFRQDHFGWVLDQKSPFGEKIIAQLSKQIYVNGHDKVFYFWEKEKKVIWLPRQDQLQEMVKFEPWEAQKTPLHRLFFRFREFVQNDDADSWWDFKDEFVSMEQLWLAFAMKEKYNKIWDEQDWILS